ncbi:hypothetical protein [Halorussus amylolyticus]|uniref:hypothetical protein n=1 Tax=Halorussus amylolyticus TaxID=1126242 RepID=UPI0010431D36|nr:hypothetical protein [Halorussus amylolyticus]
MLTDFGTLYSDVFAPELFILACTLALLGYEWRAGSESGATRLGARLFTVLAGWAVAFAIYESTGLLFDPIPAWGSDFTGSLGVGVGILLIGGVWWSRRWGRHVPTFAAALFAVTAVHIAVTPFWDVSSHVAYTAVPAGYLALADRRFAPVVAVPVGMVAARPLAGAHTWAESAAGLALAAVFVAAVAVRSSGAVERARPENN